MNNNISGSAASWLPILEEKESSTEIKAEVKETLDLTSDIESLIQFKETLAEKYSTHQNKNIYDSLIFIESAIKSLNN